jgi:hypothetical protein
VIVYYDDRSYENPRLFPYAPGNADQCGYIDFKAQPELIEVVLEDFKPSANWPAVQTFYSFLRWTNGPESQLETNDCALRTPTPNSDRNSTKRLIAHGRIFILYRDLRLNTSKPHSDWLCGKLMQLLDGIDVLFRHDEGVVGFTLTPTVQTAISKGSWRPDGSFDCGADDPGFGHHLMLSFFSYGNDEAETFGNLERVFLNILEASKLLSADIADGKRLLSEASKERPCQLQSKTDTP